MAVVVLNIRYGPEDVTIGVLADEVHEVIDLARAEIESPPQMGSRSRDELVAGIGRHDGRFVVILDIDKAFNADGAGDTQAGVW